MKTFLVIATVALSGPAIAQDVMFHGSDLQPMPEQVRIRVEELRAQGGRFDAAIAIIESQWAMPEWSGCDADIETEIIALPAV